MLHRVDLLRARVGPVSHNAGWGWSAAWGAKTSVCGRFAGLWRKTSASRVTQPLAHPSKMASSSVIEDNIRVVCRVRPLLPHSKGKISIEVPSEQTLRAGGQEFNFDFVAPTTSSQVCVRHGCASSSSLRVSAPCEAPHSRAC